MAANHLYNKQTPTYHTTMQSKYAYNFSLNLNRKEAEMSRSTVTIVALVIMPLMGCIGNSTSAKTDVTKTASIRVGTYDSRAIAVAYVNSRWNGEQYKAKKKEMEKAKAAGDNEKIAELEAWGEAKQHKQHLQGFSTAPVHEFLEKVKKELPKIAKAADIDIIVSKWEFDYQKRNAKTIDVTDEIVKLYNPSEKTLKILKELRKHKPMTEEYILKHPH